MRGVPVGAILGAIAAATLVGCSGTAPPTGPTTVTVTVAPDSTPKSASSAAPSTSNPPSSTTPIAGPTVAVGTHGTVAFASPTGRINCASYHTVDPAGWALRCDVLERTWTLPPKPAGCPGEWGGGVALDATGARLTCASDTVAYETRVGAEGAWWNGQPGSQIVHDDRRGDLVALAYGASMVIGPIVCLSRQDGMHCTNVDTNAGFDVSRESYTLR